MKKMTRTISMLALALTLTGCNMNAQAKKSDIESVSDLSGRVVACQQGTTSDALVSDMENVTIKRYPTSLETFGALVGHTSDAVVMDKETAENLVASAKDTHPNIYILEEPFVTEEYAIAYQKGNDALGEELNKALAELQEDGTIDNIKTHWVGDEADQMSYVPALAPTTERPKLRMATNATFPPYESFVDGRVIGIDADIMKAVCEKMDRELVIVNMEFENILGAVERGEVDVGVAALTVSDERKDRVDFTNSYATTNQVIIVNGDK